jgi:hypothetical protein
LVGQLVVPEAVLRRYRLEEEPEFSRPPHRLAVSGLLAGAEPTGAAIMAGAAAFDLLRFLPGCHKVVLYCDNLDAVKWLGGSREDLHESYRRHSKLVAHVLALAAAHDWRVAKVAGHAGIPLNEVVHHLATRRLDREPRPRQRP